MAGHCCSCAGADCISHWYYILLSCLLHQECNELTVALSLSFSLLLYTGALVVIGFHITVNRNIRKVAASAFYRKKPSVANVTILIRECGLVALTQGFVVVRIFRLFLTTCFYIGRLDTPFLYNSVGHLGGYRVDGEPYMFQIDILQHEVRDFWLFDVYREYRTLTSNPCMIFRRHIGIHILSTSQNTSYPTCNITCNSPMHDSL